MSFNGDYAGWQFASGVIVPGKRDEWVKEITVRCAYDYNANEAYFTDISLVLEPAETYSYDSKGNPVAATDGSAKTASEYFTDSQRLKSYTTPGGAAAQKTQTVHRNFSDSSTFAPARRIYWTANE